jgi:hypothetical protein
MPKAQIRDAHLPSPEVCDWLLSLEWSEPGSIELNTPSLEGVWEDSCYARAAIGADACIELLLPVEALECLEKDAQARMAHAHFELPYG